MKPRIAYLDIDDTLLVWTNDHAGWAAPRADQFLIWLNEHFEIRWLTMWCPIGYLDEEKAQELSMRFNHKIDPAFFLSIRNPNSFKSLKTDAVDFIESRPWVWIEDALLGNEYLILDKQLARNKFYKTNVSHDIVALQSTWRRLGRNFEIAIPEYLMEYSKEILKPSHYDAEYNKILNRSAR